MVKIFGQEISKEDLKRYVGSFSQVMGAREYSLRGGKQEGVKAVEMFNDTGLRFTILPDRGMDIVSANYRGKSLAWESKNGIIAPQYFENGGMGFLRSFAGGLVATAGLTQVGDPCKDDGFELGIHDRMHHTPAENYSIEKYWQGDEYCIRFKGTVRESCVYYENLTMMREINFKLGKAKFTMIDTVRNEGFNESPFMYLYHLNFGYPLISEATKLYTQAKKVSPYNGPAKNGNGCYAEFQKPTPGYEYELFIHDMPVGDKVYAAMINDDLKLGVYVGYSSKELPILNTWKMMGEQDYVFALEPCNCLPEGRVKAKENGTLYMLKPNEEFHCTLEFGVLDENKIEEFVSKNFI